MYRLNSMIKKGLGVKKSFLISLVLVTLVARASSETETRLYGARPSSANTQSQQTSNVTGNGASDDADFGSAGGLYLNPLGTTVVFNALSSENVRVFVTLNDATRLDERILYPGQKTIYNTRGSLVQSITATIVSSGRVLVHRTEPNNRGRWGGFYMVRRTGGYNTHIDIGGPFVGRSPVFGVTRGTVYLVNATGYRLGFESNYHDIPFCLPDKGTIQSGQGEFAELRIGGCKVDSVFGRVHTADGIKETTRYNRIDGNLYNAVFVFREDKDAWVIDGPYRLIE